MRELSEIIHSLRQLARRFTATADSEALSTYSTDYTERERKKKRIEKLRARAAKLEYTANILTAVNVDLDKDEQAVIRPR